jgi:adducin
LNFPYSFSENKINESIDFDFLGTVIDPGSTTFGINHAGYTLHSAIHKARPDLKCVIHLHTPAAVAISAMKYGLLTLSQEALFCGKVSYHDYSGILIDQNVKKKIVEDLGPNNKVMILRNHGFVACGETVEEAWRYAYNMIRACEIQARSMSVGIDQLHSPLDEKDAWVKKNFVQVF